MGRECSPCFGTLPGTPGFGGTLGPGARELLRAIELKAAAEHMPDPVYLSGCRAADYQMELRRRWDSGDREGLRVRPADPENSRHVPDSRGLCWAFDLGNESSWLEIIGPWAVRNIPGAVWGGSFIPKDQPHFEFAPDRPWTKAISIRLR